MYERNQSHSVRWKARTISNYCTFQDEGSSNRGMSISSGMARSRRGAGGGDGTGGGKAFSIIFADVSALEPWSVGVL